MLQARFDKRVGELALTVELAIAAGGITVLRGDSGSGKTTIANILAGGLAPDRGRIELDGLTVFDSAAGVDLPPHRRGVGYVFQSHRLLPNLNVRDNILFPLRAGGRRSPLDLEEIIALLGLGDLLARDTAALSGGESQRVALARALLAAERLLLLDEPLSSLDPARRQSLMDYIDRAAPKINVPILYITHSDSETRRLADRVIYLDNGHVSAVDPALRQGER